MSKLAIFLCVALFASVAQASYFSDALDKAQQKVEGIIESAINEVKEKYEAAKQKALELAGKLEAAASAFADKFYNEIKNILEKAQAEVDALTGKAEGVDVTECNKLAAHLDYTALAVISNMSSCVVDKLETGGGYIESMVKVSEDVLANLTSIKEEAHHCGDNVDGVKSAAAAIVCVNLAAAKATWAATKSVPAMAIDTTKLTYLLATLQPSLAYCSTTNGLLSFYHESSTIVEKTKQCIQQKIDEVRGVDHVEENKPESYPTEPSQTTEEVYTPEHTSTPKAFYPGESSQTTEQVAHDAHQ